MKKMFAKGILGLCFLPSAAMAINLLQYSDRIQTLDTDPSSRSTLLGISDACGAATNVDDDCVLKGLERVATEEDNLAARGMLSEYARAINEGQFSTQPECHVETHLQANRILAHCTLLLNYSGLKEQDIDKAKAQFNMCLQGGLQGLVYQGNIVAQYMLGEFYAQKGLDDPAAVWKRALRLRKDTDEYALLEKCYQ